MLDSCSNHLSFYNFSLSLSHSHTHHTHSYTSTTHTYTHTHTHTHTHTISPVYQTNKFSLNFQWFIVQYKHWIFAKTCWNVFTPLIHTIMKTLECCVFRPTNGYFGSHLMVKIIFLAFYIFFHQNIMCQNTP